MQLKDVESPRVADTPAVGGGDLPLGTRCGDTVNLKYHNMDTADQLTNKRDHSNRRILRHRCMFRNCNHSVACSSRLEAHPEPASGQRHTPPCTGLDYSQGTDVEVYQHTSLTSPGERAITPPPAGCGSDQLTWSSRGLRPGPPSPPPQPSLHHSTLPLIPLYYRRRVVHYIIEQLLVGSRGDVHKVYEIQQHIVSLEDQVFRAAKSQEEYVTLLASKLAAILQQLDKCRHHSPALPSHAPSPACF